MAGVTIREYTIEGFRAYLLGQSGRHPKATVLHHCYRPNAQQYRGKVTIDGIQRTHMSGAFPSGIAANCYTGPDGAIFNARPLSWSNWAHAYVERAWSDCYGPARDIAAGNRAWFNSWAFGVETVGDFDAEDPTTSRAIATSLDVIALVHKLYTIPVSRCFLHRDVANKTCPGKRVSREWVHSQLRARLAGGGSSTSPLKVILLPGSTVVACHTAVEGDTMRCDLRPLAETLGYEVIADHLSTQRKIYLRGRDA